MERRKPLNRFHFDNELTIDEQIDTKALRECDSVEQYRECLLALNRETTPFQALGEERFVNGLENART